jgi:HEAT repeat protein
MMWALAPIALALLAPLQDSDPAHVQALVAKLRSESIEDREEASRKLLELGKQAFPALDAAAVDPDAEVAARARSLRQELVRKALPKLLELLERDDARVDGESLRALGYATSDAGVLDLQRFLADPTSVVRGRAAESLGTLGAGDAIPALVALLGDESYYARVSAVGALIALKAQDKVYSFLRRTWTR